MSNSSNNFLNSVRFFDDIQEYLRSKNYGALFNRENEDLLNREEIERLVVLGRQYYYIADNTDTDRFFTYVSPGFRQMTGHSRDFDLKFLMEIIHPEERERVSRAAQYITEDYLMNKDYKPFETLYSMDYRIRKIDGDYLWVRKTVTNLTKDKDRNPIHWLGLCTDITDLKKGQSFNLQKIEKGPVTFPVPLSILGLKENGTIRLTQREKEIIKLLSVGMTSQSIGDELHISTHTVDTHRRNILKKTGSKNTRELMKFAVDHDLIIE